MFYKFLWNNGPDKVKRNVITQDFENGGLRMVDLSHFIQALKITWLRRLSRCNNKYFSLIETICPFINTYKQYGSDYVKIKLKIISNPFWKDVWSNYATMMEKIIIKSWSEFLSLPVWYNNKFKIAGKSFYDKSFHEKGLLFVNDFVNVNGNFYSLDEFQEKYNFTTNFLRYNNIIHCLRSNLDLTKFPHAGINEVYPMQPICVRLLDRTKKGCRILYDILNYKTAIIKSQPKWCRDLNVNNLNWNALYKIPFKILKETKLKWLQYRINHRILGTNQLLFKMNLRQDDLCSFCKTESETISHLLYDCNIVQLFWSNLKTWMNLTDPNINVEWSKPDIILGNPVFQPSVNQLIIFTKFFIYQSKMKQSLLDISIFKKQLLYYYKTEKLIATKTFNMNKFNKFWSPLLLLIQTL